MYIETVENENTNKEAFTVETESYEETASTPADAEQTDDNQEDEIVVSIGEETPPQNEESTAPQWVKDLRKKHRDTTKELHELKQRYEQATNTVKSVELEAKPTLAQFDYDEEEFNTAIDSWHNKKREFDARQVQIRAEQEKAQAEWQGRVKFYETLKADLKVKNYDEAEDNIKESLNQVQQSIILQGAENPALIVYALGMNNAKMKEIAEIKDPVKFAFAIAKLEGTLKVTTRKAPPPPEKTVKGSAGFQSSSNSMLEKLRDEAARTGDASKLMAYKKTLKG